MGRRIQEPIPDELITRAAIAGNGAVLLGRNVVCDGHAERPVRVVTHGHRDHILGLEQSIKSCEVVLMSEATREMLRVLKPGKWLSSPKVRTMGHGEEFHYQGEAVTFLPSGHILGSIQVVLRDRDGVRAVYTGDFKFPGAEAIKADILVMEATYGNPKHVRRFEVEGRLVSLVKEALEREPVYIFGYHGKLQEVLDLLRRAGLDIPALLEGKVFDLARVSEKYGMRLGEYSKLEKGAPERMDRPFLALLHMFSAKKVPSGALKVFLSGWEFEEPVRRKAEREYIVAFSDHADFEGLIEYVIRSRPNLVIIDDYRIGDAKTLAREIRKRLGIPAVAMP
jgi:putative mRNA 3-end processing factor